MVFLFEFGVVVGTLLAAHFMRAQARLHLDPVRARRPGRGGALTGEACNATAKLPIANITSILCTKARMVCFFMISLSVG